VTVRGRSARGPRVASIDELSDREWQQALACSGHPFRFSHRAAAGRALEAAFDSYRFTPCRVEYTDGAAALYPLVRVERRLPAMSMVLGMPLGLEGTPIVVSGGISATHVVSLFYALDHCGVLELNGGAGGSPPQLGEGESVSTHVLDLGGGFEYVWRQAFSDKTRNMCRKGERAGVLVAEESTADGIAEYHRLYSRSAAGWGYDAPPYPRRLLEALVGAGGELWIARLDGVPVAGAVLLEGSDDLLYWSGAMDREYRRAAPTNTLLRVAIESACRRGIRYFDFGASAGLSGVESFKRSFGGTERAYRNTRRTTGTYRRLETLRRSLGRSVRGKWRDLIPGGHSATGRAF
jgi:hypothetical protein